MLIYINLLKQTQNEDKPYCFLPLAKDLGLDPKTEHAHNGDQCRKGC